MKIAIKGKENLSLRLAVLLKKCVAAKKEELFLFSTTDVKDSIVNLLQKSEKITEIHVSDKVIYLTQGLKIQIEVIDGYE